jgi:hypothetical protein
MDMIYIGIVAVNIASQDGSDAESTAAKQNICSINGAFSTQPPTHLPESPGCVSTLSTSERGETRRNGSSSSGRRGKPQLERLAELPGG